jgi:hypothetical protein
VTLCVRLPAQRVEGADLPPLQIGAPESDTGRRRSAAVPPKTNSAIAIDQAMTVRYRPGLKPFRLPVITRQQDEAACSSYIIYTQTSIYMLIYLLLSRCMKRTQRYTDRIMKRYRDDGLEAAIRYGCDLFGCQRAYCKAILKSLPPPLRVGRTPWLWRSGRRKTNKHNAPPPKLRSRTGNNNLKKDVPPKSCWMTWMWQAVPPSDY